MKGLSIYIKESQEQKKYVNMIVVTPDDEVLILRRSYYMKKFRNLWGFPGGSLDQKDKNEKEGAIRELKEETGIELTWNEENRYCEKFREIENNDGSLSIYYKVTLESKPKKIELSGEHSKYDWYDYRKKEAYKWMPDAFQLIQEINK